MTGPPREISPPERQSPVGRMAQTAAVPELLASPPPGASPAAYQLSLAHVLPWLEGTPSSKASKPFLLPPVPAVVSAASPAVSAPNYSQHHHQQQQQQQQQHHHQSSAAPTGWSWDSGGGGGYQYGSPNYLAVSAGTNGAGARASHYSVRKSSASGCPNVTLTARQADHVKANKQRHGADVNYSASGRAVSPLAIQQLQQLTGPHHLNAFPPQSFSLTSASKTQSPSATSVAININGNISGPNSGGNSLSDVGNCNSSCASITAPAASVTSRTYSVQLPGLTPARSLRPRGSFSSCSGAGSNFGVGGAAGSVSASISGLAGAGPNSSASLYVPSSSSSTHAAPQSSREGSSRRLASGSRRHIALVVRG
ncbi:hypothetical protein EGW08_010459 [Elysia chlorotica]|uniref:Uncharacterized protein n=1 Tax=Elysia chlorotica TaxID=188477 RepID=A0A433TJJ6_ELYCH|nr:hypothetical protein EGW08_010459 [Elysia chlorotica]